MAKRIDVDFELKPCPFCGASADMYLKSFPRANTYIVCCSRHKNGCHLKHDLSDGFNTAEEAAMAWNRRTQSTDNTDSIVTTINRFAAEVHENAVQHGWWDGGERTFGELIALCHSELSEALEEYRKGHLPNGNYYGDNGKPEGVPTELADVILRILDVCGHYGIDIGVMLRQKHEFNKARPYKHGGKII